MPTAMDNCQWNGPLPGILNYGITIVLVPLSYKWHDTCMLHMLKMKAQHILFHTLCDSIVLCFSSIRSYQENTKKVCKILQVMNYYGYDDRWGVLCGRKLLPADNYAFWHANVNHSLSDATSGVTIVGKTHYQISFHIQLSRWVMNSCGQIPNCRP